MQELRRDPDVIDDALLLDYVQSLWTPLLDAARQRGELTEELDAHDAWEPFLVRDRSINAFALPGGYIGVHLGLISLTASRDELAAVMAHELSHVTQRHIARMMASSRRQSMLGVAAMILGVMAASRSPDAASAMIVSGQAGMAQGQLNFSRDMEREADRVGFGVLEGAGFAPAGMTQMFDKLQFAARLNDSQQYPYLRSHPLTSERIGEARQRLGLAQLYSAPANADALRWLHAVMQGRARALMDARHDSLRRLADLLGSPTQGPEALAQAYAGTLAALRLQDAAAVQLGLQRSLALGAGQPLLQPALRQLQIEVAIEQGRPAQALQLWQGGTASGTRAELLLGAQVVLAQPADAAAAQWQPQSERLRTWLALHPGDASVWGLLATLQERLGQGGAALRAQAEQRLALGDLSGAIDRLRAGQRQMRTSGAADSVEATVIDARLHALEQRRRKELLEERPGSREGGEP
jgi:predicted Zn-dependent protease